MGDNNPSSSARGSSDNEEKVSDSFWNESLDLDRFIEEHRNLEPRVTAGSMEIEGLTSDTDSEYCVSIADTEESTDSKSKYETVLEKKKKKKKKSKNSTPAPMLPLKYAFTPIFSRTKNIKQRLTSSLREMWKSGRRECSGSPRTDDERSPRGKSTVEVKPLPPPRQTLYSGKVYCFDEKRFTWLFSTFAFTDDDRLLITFIADPNCSKVSQRIFKLANYDKFGYCGPSTVIDETLHNPSLYAPCSKGTFLIFPLLINDEDDASLMMSEDLRLQFLYADDFVDFVLYWSRQYNSYFLPFKLEAHEDYFMKRKIEVEANPIDAKTRAKSIFRDREGNYFGLLYYYHVKQRTWKLTSFDFTKKEKLKFHSVLTNENRTRKTKKIQLNSHSRPSAMFGLSTEEEEEDNLSGEPQDQPPGCDPRLLTFIEFNAVKFRIGSFKNESVWLQFICAEDFVDFIEMITNKFCQGSTPFASNHFRAEYGLLKERLEQPPRPALARPVNPGIVFHNRPRGDSPSSSQSPRKRILPAGNLEQSLDALLSVHPEKVRRLEEIYYDDDIDLEYQMYNFDKLKRKWRVCIVDFESENYIKITYVDEDEDDERPPEEGGNEEELETAGDEEGSSKEVQERCREVQDEQVAREAREEFVPDEEEEEKGVVQDSKVYRIVPDYDYNDAYTGSTARTRGRGTLPTFKPGDTEIKTLLLFEPAGCKITMEDFKEGLYLEKEKIAEIEAANARPDLWFQFESKKDYIRFVRLWARKFNDSHGSSIFSMNSISWHNYEALREETDNDNEDNE